MNKTWNNIYALLCITISSWSLVSLLFLYVKPESYQIWDYVVLVVLMYNFVVPLFLAIFFKYIFNEHQISGVR